MSTKKLVSFDEMIFIFKFCLRTLGILPSTFVRQQLLSIYFILSSCIDSSMFLVDTIVKNLTSVDAIYETFGTVGINVRFYILLANRREFSELIEACAELWNYCDANTQLLVMNFERKIRILFWMIFASISICINLMYSFNAINVSYLSKDHVNTTKILPFRWYGIEDIESTWPGYKIAFILQVWVTSNSGLISATVDSALPLMMVLCCGYFQVLRNKLEHIDYKSFDNSVLIDYEFIHCCKFHQKILILCSRLEKLGRLMFLIELSSSGYVLGLIAIKLAGSDPDKYKYFPVLCALLFHILICQWAADLLADESKNVSTAAYSVSCTFMERPSSKHLIIMILKAQQPLFMTAGGCVILSLQNFGKMLTSAVSLYTAMSNLVD